MPKTEINFPARPFAFIGILILAITALTSCGGILPQASGGGTPDKPGNPSNALTVTVTPASSEVRVGATVQFSAAVSNSTNRAVSWTVNGIAGGDSTVGKVDSTGLYQAPANLPSPNPVSIEATSAADTTVSDSAKATIENPVPTVVAVLPASVPPGNFTLSVSGTNFANGAVVVWGTKFLTTIFVSPTTLRAIGSESVAGMFKVTVLNPDPGSAVSGAFNVMVAAAPPAPKLVSSAAAARLLEQSTWGPTPPYISNIQTIGMAKFIDVQMSLAPSFYSGPPPSASMDYVQNQLFFNARNKFDLLRQRVAFALSEIMVASANKVNDPSAFVFWQNMFLRDAFGNFLTLLTDVTLNPTMGNYLDRVNNDKPDPIAGTAPNENYAREVLQLFTIGLNQLNPDGTLQLDGTGSPIPTYTQDTVEGFAHVFTGWTYATKPGATGHFGNPVYYRAPMIPFDDHHDTGPKELLNGVILPAGGTARADLNAALRNIFQHPNVGPFISKQLIQHLVTSNPSPEYVGRIAAVFNDNGKGVRGDLRAVITALLLDPEARRGDDPTQAQPSDGRLKEPVQFILNITHALNGVGDGACMASYASAMKQPPFFSPSVFNFFHPDHVVEGTNLLGPEFEILDSGTTVNRINFVNTYVYGTPCGNNRPTLAPYVAVASNPAKLVDTIASIMLHGDMSAEMRNTLITTISTIPDYTKRAQAALYLVGTSSQFQVQH